MSQLKAITIIDEGTLDLIRAEQTAEGELSATSTARRLIRDGLTYRRLRDAGQIQKPVTPAPAPPPAVPAQV